MRRSVIFAFNPCSTKPELIQPMVIILQLLLLEKYRGPDLGDLSGRYGPGHNMSVTNLCLLQLNFWDFAILLLHHLLLFLLHVV